MPEVRAKSVAELIDKAFDDGKQMHEILDRFHNSVIVRALNRTHGNASHAATLLGIHRNNIARWLKKYNMKLADFHGNGNQ